MRPLPATRLRHSRLVDRVIAAAITVGGSVVLLAVAFLMIFLVAECMPLFRSAATSPEQTTPSDATVLAALEDEYRTAVVVVGSDGAIRRVTGTSAGAAELLAGVIGPVTTALTSPDGVILALVDSAATLRTFALTTRIRWQGARRINETTIDPRWSTTIPAAARLLAVGGSAVAPAVLLSAADGAVLVSAESEGPTSATIALTLGAPATTGAVSRDASQVWLTGSRELAWFQLDSSVGPLAPAATQPLDGQTTVAAPLLGDTTLLLGDDGGAVTAWQVVTGAVTGSHRLERSAVFPGRGRVRALAPSQRDKTFAVLRDGGGAIFHLTTRRKLATIGELPAGATLIGLSPRRDGGWVVSHDGLVARFALAVAHPEVSASTLFLPVRYEGYSTASLVWQSTGGSASFEPKLSLIPLLVGTIKGAFYALLFSAPLGILAALYVSQFAPPRLRQFAKPTVELMAALPSVVVGFLAALVLAPVLQRHVVAVLGSLVAIPLALVAGAVVLRAMPIRVRRHVDGALEIALVGGLLALATGLVFRFEAAIAQTLFAGDIEHWLLHSAGITYDQRNALVVGFALGFAVIPIIFTLAEDAFANVPPSLVSASLALGASRWQAARTVVLPASSPGLFAAVMTGFGRAVGETMIVLMATGNTPILSFSPFNGMRTMSANIAVELPEAPWGGTLYRVLILTALLLFAMTFVINTLAVLVAERLRQRFGRLAA